MLLRPVLMPILRNPLQGIADGIRNMLAELLGSSQFFAPLTHSLVLSRGTGSPTFTRVDPTPRATFRDWEGVLKTAPSGCARFEGARMVYNLWTTSSATLANGANKSLTLAAGDYTFSMGAGTGTATFSGTGGATGTLAASASGRVEVTKTITAGTFVVTASVADLVDLQVEDVTGQADQTASEYVSVGVLSAPYHGAGVDGVEFFNTDRDGAVIPAATNTGYLAEGARTNLCLQSQSFDTTWTATALTTISSTRTAPDGTATAFEFDDGVSGGTSHRRFQSPVNTTAVPHTMSVYAKDVDRGWIGFRLTDSGGVNRLCWFNIAAGVVGTAEAGFTTSIQSLPNGWYRCIATLTTFAGDSTPLLFLAPSDGVDVYVGSNKKAQLWGAQLELGSFASTYIPTTTAAVTRAADVLTYTGGDIANLKTLCATFRREVGVVGTGESVALSDGTTTNYIVHAAQPNGTDVRFLSEASSVTQWSVITAYTPGTTTKMATSFATNDIKMAKDGVGQTPDTVATVPAFTQLNVGHVAGILQLNGTTRGVYGWTRNLSQSELNAITA